MTQEQLNYFNQFGIIVSFGEGNNPSINIQNSYLVQEKTKIKEILAFIHNMDEYEKLKLAGYTRTNKSQVNEWAGHNFLYNLNYKKERTGSVSIDQHEPMWRRFCYAIFNIFTK